MAVIRTAKSSENMANTATRRGPPRKPGMSVRFTMTAGHERGQQARRHVQEPLVEEGAAPAHEAALQHRHHERAHEPQRQHDDAREDERQEIARRVGPRGRAEDGAEEDAERHRVERDLPGEMQKRRAGGAGSSGHARLRYVRRRARVKHPGGDAFSARGAWSGDEPVAEAHDGLHVVPGRAAA